MREMWKIGIHFRTEPYQLDLARSRVCSEARLVVVRDQVLPSPTELSYYVGHPEGLLSRLQRTPCQTVGSVGKHTQPDALSLRAAM